MPTDPHILSVTELNRQARVTIEHHFQTVWVTGEMSNFARPRSGHWYFSLKDQQAQVRCAMFVNRNRAVQMQPGDGQQVLIRGRVSLYEGRGEFQIIADYMEPAGEGMLRQAFDQLKLKLSGEGLFDNERKQPLPAYPQTVAVITSPTGAALHDILAVWQRRYPLLNVVLVPSLVQGAQAEQQLLNGLARACDLNPDVILLTRGGGSLEDLWSFNSEALARAIAHTEILVVSAVGHEIDTTISDLVADVRAPTPSAAAELMTPDQHELNQEFDAFAYHLTNMQTAKIENLRLKLSHAQKRLPQPQQVLDRLAQRIDDSASRLHRQQRLSLKTASAHITALLRQLPLVGPASQLNRMQTHLGHTTHLLTRATQQAIRNKQDHHGQLARMLNNLSPLPTLDRGYAIVRNEQGNVVSSVEQLDPQDAITTLLTDGTVHSRIEQITDKTLKDT